MKCGICGTHGHIDTACALFNLNAEQEARQLLKLQNARLGLTPKLEREIELIRRNWKLGIVQQSCAGGIQ